MKAILRFSFPALQTTVNLELFQTAVDLQHISQIVSVTNSAVFIYVHCVKQVKVKLLSFRNTKQKDFHTKVLFSLCFTA